MLSITIKTEDIDENYEDLIAALEEDAVHVDVGIHAASGEEMLKIAGAHEFGASIKSPGGQPFFITDDPKWAAVENSAPLDDGKTIVFMAKGRAGAKTKPHEIEIPARPFVRSTMDEKGAGYTEQMGSFWQSILDGKIGIRQALLLMGEQVQGDIKNKIVSIDTPPNAESTIRKKKGVDNPLVDTGAMLNSVRYEVKNVQEQTVENG